MRILDATRLSSDFHREERVTISQRHVLPCIVGEISSHRVGTVSKFSG
jgi:hypothetical protein